jgi:hypothetical protein
MSLGFFLNPKLQLQAIHDIQVQRQQQASRPPTELEPFKLARYAFAIQCV